MKLHHFLLIAIIISSCYQNKKPSTAKKAITNENQVVSTAFQSLIDSAKVTGAILIYDAQKDRYYSNDFTWSKIERLPASTFKIANSIIGLESGVIVGDSTIFKWDGQKRMLKNWEQDLMLRDAFHFSCVPCYQEVARKIGVKRMNAYLSKLNYGNMQVDSANIDRFWLEGDARINQFQQIDFLKRFHESKLTISERTETIMKRLMVIKSYKNYTLSGKTGLAVSSGKDNGWFVGYIEKGNQIYYFATNIAPLIPFDRKQFLTTRKTITIAALDKLGILDKKNRSQ